MPRQEGVPPSEEAPSKRRCKSWWGGLSKAAKAAALGLCGAVFAGIGITIQNLVQQNVTPVVHIVTHAFVGGSEPGPLDYHVEAPGTFFSGHLAAPYYVVARSKVATPDDLGKKAMGNGTGSNDALSYQWVTSHGGMAGSPQVVRVEFESTVSSPITIQRVQPLVVRVSKPLRGWYVAKLGCGPEPVWHADFDLDAREARAGYVSIGGQQRRALALSVGHKPTILEFWASTRAHTIGWEAEVYYSVGLTDKRMVITDSGHPFWVTSELRSAAYKAVWGRHGFTPRRHAAWDRTGPTGC